MSIEKLKTQIQIANDAYRFGKPIMSDQDFDDLCDKLEEQMPINKWNEFRNSLHEKSGKVKHPYVMGSLDKLKYEEPDSVLKFISNYVNRVMSITKKVDGISCRLHYSNGKLMSATTRGDGYHGEWISDKIKYVKGVRDNIGLTEEVDIRGELVIKKNDFEDLNENGEWKNPRNATAGLMNRKEWSKEDISHISFIPYTILGGKWTKHEQLEFLNTWGFETVLSWEYDVSKTDDLIDKLFELANSETDYECDGLVLSDINYKNEDDYRPDAQKAFKINQQVGVTRLIDVNWSLPSKDGKIVPVGCVEPIELGGALICNVTLHNLDFIKNMNLKYGSLVEIKRSGDVIPYLNKVIDNTNASEIEIPTHCQSCGSELVVDGVDLRCINKDCTERKFNVVMQLIKKLDIKNVSLATVKNWNLSTIDDVLKFRPNEKYKNEVKFYNELKDKMFTKSEHDLFCAMNFKGLSEVLLNKIVDFYGLQNIKDNIDCISSLVESRGYPDGVGQLFMDRFIENVKNALDDVQKIISDGRYSYVENVIVSKKSNVIGSICVTGSLNFGSRNKFLQMALEHGYESKGGVSKGLTYLINNDVTSTSSKNKKAKELGIKIISEAEFLKLIKSNDEYSLEDL